MTRLLITGASGLLGANLVLETQKRFDVTAVVHTQNVVYKNARVVKADLSETSSVYQVFEDCRPDWTIHCAADTAIDALELDPDQAHRLNTQMAAEVAKRAASIQSQFLFISTDSVFDGQAGPYREDDNPAPLNVYARSKWRGERAVAEQHPGALIVRTNLFGWSLAQNKSLAEWFHSKLSKREVCTGFSDIYFTPVYAPALAGIFVQLLERRLSGLYHIPGDECLSKFEFGRRMAKIFSFEPELIESGVSQQAQWTAARPKKTCLDGSKLTQTLGVPLPRLEEGLIRFKADFENGLMDTLRIRSKMEAENA